MKENKMAVLIGNGMYHVRHRGASGPLGLSYPQVSEPLSYCQVVGEKAGDIAYIKATDYLTGKFNQCTYAQAVGASVTVEFTLQNEARASDPDEEVQKTIAWVNKTTIDEGAIVALDPIACCCMKVTFSAPGTLYVITR